MPYNTGLAGLREASLDAIKALIVAKLGDLNTQLAARAAPLSLITGVAAQVQVGDVETLPDPATNPFWIAVIGGGRQDGRDMVAEIFQSGPGYKRTFYTNIFLYLHPDSLPGTDARVQGEARERLRAILQDWLEGDVFNNGTNVTVTLTSKHMNPAVFDTIDECKVTDITAGISAKSFGGSQLVYMLHMVHQGKVYGGV